MVKIQFSLIKKIYRLDVSRTLANPPHPYVQQHLIFALLPPTPTPLLKVDVICVSHPNFTIYLYLHNLYFHIFLKCVYLLP